MRIFGIAFATCLLVAPPTAWGQLGLLATPNPLDFNVPAGGSTGSQAVNITFNGVPVTVNSISSITTTGQNWLQANISGTTSVVIVTVNPSGLAASIYNGTVTALTSNGQVSFAVNLTVGAGVPPATPAPSSLILVLTGLLGVGLYQAKRVSAIWR
jgi:hypothetical protein